MQKSGFRGISTDVQEQRNRKLMDIIDALELRLRRYKAARRRAVFFRLDLLI
jgi:hypothetical protein